MKTNPHRPLPRRLANVAVPQFVILLGVLHEAAVRGLALFPDAPDPRHFPRFGKPARHLFQGLEKASAQ
jgi:hypothetical protein